MVDQSSEDAGTNYSNDTNLRVRDLEEKQRMLKDRLLLVGQNMIDMREKHNEEITEMKKDLEVIKENMKQLASFLETASSEFSKFAKKEDLEILAKQAKMFQPLEIVKKDLKK